MNNVSILVPEIMNSLFRHLPLSLVMMAWFLSGCSHTYPVIFKSEKARGDTVTATTVNRRLADRSATIITGDGRELSISDIFLTRDSVLFNGPTGRTYIPTADVLTIRKVDHFSSAVGGFGLGLLGGFTVGMGAAFLMADRSSADSRMGAGLLAIGVTVAGSLIGLGVGAIHGTITDYALPATVTHDNPMTIPPTAVRASEPQKVQLDSVVEFLLTSAATDFHKHPPSAIIRFRDVRVGHMATPSGEPHYLLCGEFLPGEEADNAKWVPFATIKTSGYEQWIGAQAAAFCHDSSVIWDTRGDLSSLLQRRFDSL